MIRNDTMSSRLSNTLSKPRLLMLCAGLVLGACSNQDDAAPTQDATPPAAASTSTEAPATAEAIAPATPAAPAAPVAPAIYEFAFTAQGDAADKDPRVVRWEGGPCGESPVARVETMPIDDKALLPDFVVEYDATGKEIKRWGKPYEAEVIALDGDRLQFRTDASHAYWTDTEGAIGALEAGDAPPPALDAPLLDCPALPSFAESEYEQCYDVADAAGQRRKLAWEGVCS